MGDDLCTFKVEEICARASPHVDSFHELINIGYPRKPYRLARALTLLFFIARMVGSTSSRVQLM